MPGWLRCAVGLYGTGLLVGGAYLYYYLGKQKREYIEDSSDISALNESSRSMASHPTGVWLREATIEDARMLLDWRNDELTRSVSLGSEKIPWDGHLAWFKRVFADEV